MSEKLENSGKKLDLYRARGEAVPLWVPLCLAFLGIMNSIYIAQSFLYSDFIATDLFLWSANVIKRYDQDAERTHAHGDTELLEGKAEDDAVVKTEMHEVVVAEPVVTDEDSDAISTLSGEIVTSAANNDLLEPPTSDDGAETGRLPDVENQTDEAVMNMNASDVESEQLALKDCPPFFSFAFPRGSETPRVQNLMPKIKRLKSWLEENPQAKVFIEGHADSSGPEELNLLLSYRRAKTAEKILIQAGIAKGQLLTRAFGEDEPIQGQSARSEKNRRASIRVEPLPECNNTLINGDSN